MESISLLNGVVFEEETINRRMGEVTLYFAAPKEALRSLKDIGEITNDYPEAVSAEYSLAFPLDHIELDYGTVSVSPTNSDGEDYDWTDITTDSGFIRGLMRRASDSIEQLGKLYFA